MQQSRSSTEVSAAKLAGQALGIKPLGIPWGGSEPITCALEGLPIAPGEKVAPWRPGPNFMDDVTDTVTRAGGDSAVISGYVAALMQKTVMLKSQRMVFTPEGAYPLNTDAARAWFFLTPPEPPFVAVIADAMLQHLIWRTPVTLSQDLIVFRHGQSLKTVYRPRLERVLAALRAHDAPAFIRLDRDGKDPRHGQLRNDVPEALAKELAELTPGELIALASLAKRNPPEPERPAPVRIEI